MWFSPLDQQVLFTKNDKEDPRLAEFVQIEPPFATLENFKISNSVDFYILGYADDEGIAMNGGRIGAAKAPEVIRKQLYKMTPDLRAIKNPSLIDLGNMSLYDSLANRHERARQVVAKIANGNKKFISFGGGHDYGYADVCGFLDAFKDQAVIINFDAHLDVRPVSNGFHSGTPFYRMLSEFSKQVHFFEVGLQNQCNSQSHFQWARAHGAQLLTVDDLKYGLLQTLQKALQGLEHKKLFLSIDMDVFSSSEAPGCSQSWPTGIRSSDFFQCFEWLCNNFDITGIGLYETSPPLDFDNQTSKLAALIAHSFIFNDELDPNFKKKEPSR